MAETTTAARSPVVTTWRLMRAATLRMRSRSATEVPPYFCTTSVTREARIPRYGAARPAQAGAPAVIDGRALLITWPTLGKARRPEIRTRTRAPSAAIGTSIDQDELAKFQQLGR